MNAETPKPPPFYCPACGKKHRADLSELQSREGAVAKVPCHRCGVEMLLTIGSDGLPKCETREPAPGASAPLPPGSLAVPGASFGGTMSKSSVVLQLLAAVVVAAVVAFLVVNFTKGDDEKASAAGDDTRLQALEQRVQDAEQQMQELRSLAETARRAGDTFAQEMRSSIAAAQKGLEANSQSVAALEQIQSQASQAFEKLSDAYKALNGRIEANYQKARMMDKRLKALEEEGAE